MKEFEPLTDNEAALIYCIIGRNKEGLPPTVEEALAYFNPSSKSTKPKGEDLESTNCVLEQMTFV